MGGANAAKVSKPAQLTEVMKVKEVWEAVKPMNRVEQVEFTEGVEEVEATDARDGVAHVEANETMVEVEATVALEAMMEAMVGEPAAGGATPSAALSQPMLVPVPGASEMHPTNEDEAGLTMDVASELPSTPSELGGVRDTASRDDFMWDLNRSDDEDDLIQDDVEDMPVEEEEALYGMHSM
jgi:hypothetical protein